MEQAIRREVDEGAGSAVADDRLVTGHRGLDAVDPYPQVPYPGEVALQCVTLLEWNAMYSEPRTPQRRFVFYSDCDPLGTNPDGSEVFAIVSAIGPGGRGRDGGKRGAAQPIGIVALLVVTNSAAAGSLTDVFRSPQFRHLGLAPLGPALASTVASTYAVASASSSVIYGFKPGARYAGAPAGTASRAIRI